MRMCRLAPLAAALVLLVMPLAGAAVAGHGGPIKAIAVSADGRTALTGSFDYTVILWNLITDTPLRRLVGHNAAVDSVAFLPGGRAISGSDDASLILWSLADGKPVARWKAHTAKVASVAVAPGGAIVASGAWDHRVIVWTVATGASRVLKGHEANVNAVVFSPDGALLASGDYNGRIMLWRMPSGTPARMLRGNGFPVNALAFAPNGRLLAALGDDTVRVFDPATKREVLRYAGHTEPVVSLAVSRNGTLAASGSSRGTIEIWRIATGEKLRSIYATLGPAWAVAFLGGDGREARILSGGSDGALREWSVATGIEVSGGRAAIRPPPEPTDRGARLFRKCQACHDFDPNDRSKAGPTFWHLIGRRAGSVPGYPYSSVLKTSHLVWNEATIDRLFADGPQVVAPGSKMPLQKMPSALDRADLIKYLKLHASGGRVE